MKKNLFKGLLLGCSVMVLLNACVKDDRATGAQSAGNGPSYVRIAEAQVYNQFFAPFTTINPITVFTVRRDAASAAVLQGSNTVVLTDITTAYLASHTTVYSAMPSTLYTVASQAGVSYSSGVLTLAYGPGDFAKSIVFNIDGSKVDLSKQYAVAYTITNTGGLTRKAGLDTILATVAIKNAYDGVYSYAGSLARFNADGSADVVSTLGGTIVGGVTISLATTSGTTDAYSPGLYWSDGVTGVGGITGIQLAVDPATYKVTTTASGNAYVANIAGQDNYYDPASKTFHLNFGWYTAAPPASSRQAHLTLTYKSSR